tara:strand:- start:319 stop:489 length:171 start_codon:yes stop_codon:yes gene_type:complete
MNNYYVAWIPPNRDFKVIACNGTENVSLTTATRIANKLNNETRGSLGHYAARENPK